LYEGTRLWEALASFEAAEGTGMIANRTRNSLDTLDLLQESVVVLDGDTKITAWNAASERLYGWSRRDAIGRPIHELLRTRREAIPIIEAALSKDGTWAGEVVRRTAQGGAITVRMTCDARSGNELIETAIDISAQRRLEEALSRAEHRYYNVFQAMAVSFWELDFSAVGSMVQRLIRSGVADLASYFAKHPGFVREMIHATRVIDVNDQSVALFGRRNKEEMLADLGPYWPEESYHVYAASVVAAVQGLPKFATETRLSSIDGREFDVWFTACFPPEMLSRGKLLIGIIDISQDKQAKVALETSEFRYRKLFHFLPVAMVQLDRRDLAEVFANLRAQGIPDLMEYFAENPGFYEFATNSIQVIEVNHRTIELFAAEDASQLLGPVARLWSEGRDTIQRAMAARFAGAERFEAEMKIRTFDNRIRDVLYVAHFPEALNQTAIGLSCLVDISDHVKAQAMLTQLQGEFAHAARVSMLGELTASIAHEINQPLGAILTNAEAALRWMNRPEPDISELRALSVRTVADATRAADIIRRIRNMAARGDSEQTALSVNSVVEEVMIFLEPELRRHQVRVELELHPALPKVMADRIQLQQVFSNLAVNAIQAMVNSVSRQLTLRTGLVGNSTVAVHVVDTGPGVPTEHLDRLFDSFFTTKPGGMGIGLAICRSIAESHGGRIEASNREDNVGACFCFTLPALST
jgi:PAS domain S-box-containing protein